MKGVGIDRSLPMLARRTIIITKSPLTSQIFEAIKMIGRRWLRDWAR